MSHCDGYTCAPTAQTVPATPNNALIGFDNLPVSFLTLFSVMTLDKYVPLCCGHVCTGASLNGGCVGISFTSVSLTRCGVAGLISLKCFLVLD